MTDQIRQGLTLLDPANAEHWTENGAPRIDTLAALMQTKPTEITRRQITEAAPGLTRETFAQWVEAQADEGLTDDEGPDEPGDETDSKGRAEYAALLLALQGEQQTLIQQEGEARRARLDKQLEIDALINERARLYPPRHPSEVMKEHLQKVHQQRVERVMEGRGRSPLDTRLASRKRSDTRPPLTHAQLAPAPKLD